MKTDVQKLAQQIKAGLRSAGSVRIWGINLSRPGDFVYELQAARVVGAGTLRLSLKLGTDQVSPVVEVDAPSGASLANGNLTIQAASAVRLDGKEKKATPEAAGDPALFIGD